MLFESLRGLALKLVTGANALLKIILSSIIFVGKQVKQACHFSVGMRLAVVLGIHIALLYLA